MKIEKIEINKLKPATYNPRQISTKQYKDLKSSVEKFGLVDPIITNKDFTIIGGHQRYKICKELKHKEIDCVVLDLSKEEERELNIRLNKNTGDFDMDILANEFDIDELVDWGFKHIDLDINIDKITEGNIEDDHIPEVKESRVKLGDVWKLGKHRLMCGDSTKESDVEKLMNGQKADMVFTDPPYNSAFNGRSGKFEVIANDNLSKDDFSTFINEFIDTLKLCKCSEMYVCCDWRMYLNIGNLFNHNQLIVWNKDIPCMGKGYRNKHEFIMYYGELKSTTETNVWEEVAIQSGASKDDGGNGWFQGGNKQLRIHPTQKPISIPSRAIKNSSKKNEIVLDLFLGSGSTLIACEKTNRVCYGMELDTKYCDVIIERWEQFTGQKATKL